MSDRPIACPGTLVLTDTEHAMLSALPYPAHELHREHWCELQNGHEDLHHTLGQASLDEAWWLRWDDNGHHREITALPDCAAQQAGADPEPCTLPARHAGAHSFEYDLIDR
jgi:hypothetical protein